MNATDSLKTLSDNILKLRKESGLTQENLAEKLNISFQAVSKWENGQTSPDIIMLPMLAQLFGVSIDKLFGIKINEEIKKNFTLKWDDDDTIHCVIFKGKRIINSVEDLSNYTLTIEGNALNVEAGCNVSCNNVEGNVSAKGGVNCNNVGGDVAAGGGVNCNCVEGDAAAGGSITCNCINGNVNKQ
ncbi:MAG: helix-turn-helix transcriptional regulator [Treponema sp.]|nr:helix-turn-helix transcriptional regulator [Treponema sp.]